MKEYKNSWDLSSLFKDTKSADKALESAMSMAVGFEGKYNKKLKSDRKSVV